MRSQKNLSVENFIEGFKNQEIIIPEYQRNYVWGDEDDFKEADSDSFQPIEGNPQLSDLIHTILCDDPMPSFLYEKKVVDGKVVLEVMDGQQRGKSMYFFVEKKAFYLNDETESVDFNLFPKVPQTLIGVEEYLDESGEVKTKEVIKIGGLTFEQLPVEMQKAILRYEIQGQMLDEGPDGINKKRRTRVFDRYNRGMQLTEDERFKSDSEKVGLFIDKLMNMPFLHGGLVNVAKAKANRQVNFGMVMQMLYLLHLNQPADIGSKAYKAFGYKYVESGLPEQLENKAIAVVDYLGKAFTEKEKFLVKTHIPIMALLATKAISEGIDANKFASIMYRFYTEDQHKDEWRLLISGRDRSYASASTAKNSEKIQVQTRLMILSNYFSLACQNEVVTYLPPSERKRIEKEAKRAEKERLKKEQEQSKNQTNEESPLSVSPSPLDLDRDIVHKLPDKNGQQNTSEEDGDIGGTQSNLVDENVSQNVSWILHTSVDDVNYKGALERLTDDEIVYCLKKETRTSSLKKLKSQAKKRGLATE